MFQCTLNKEKIDCFEMSTFCAKKLKVYKLLAEDLPDIYLFSNKHVADTYLELKICTSLRQWQTMITERCLVCILHVY